MSYNKIRILDAIKGTNSKKNAERRFVLCGAQLATISNQQFQLINKTFTNTETQVY